MIYYRCISGECIPKTWECDHEPDCHDGSDEHEHCAPLTCSSESFTCDNGRCVDKKLRCNLMDDCGDLSDELNCKKEGNDLHLCPDSQFLCNVNATDCVPDNARYLFLILLIKTTINNEYFILFAC